LGHATSYTYDAQGHVLTTIDANGNQTINGYDTKGNLTSTSDALGHTTTNKYDTNGNLLSTVDAAGIRTAYTYDGSGFLLSQVVAPGKTEAQAVTYTYDSNGNKVSETKTSSVGTFTTLFSYDGMGRLVKTDNPDGTNTQTSYDSLGHTVGTQDQKGRSTSYFYDAQGHQSRIEYSDLTTQTYGYDLAGRRTSSTDRGGRTTTTQYDAAGRAVTVTYQDNSYTATNYDVQGRVSSTADENNHATQYQYDQAGRKTQTTDALSHTTYYYYDSNGNQTSVQDANGHITGYLYDALNRQTQVNFQDGTNTLTTYDADGRKTLFKDQAGNTTSYAYDGLGRLTSVQDAMGHTTGFTYDQQGNELTQTDAEGRVTTYTYDAMNRRKTRTLPGGQVERYTYDNAGNMTVKTTFSNKTINYGYDTNTDRLTSVTGQGVTLAYRYDNAGDRVVMNDASGATTFNHDERDRQTAKKGPFGNLTYSRDNVGNLTGISSNNTNGTYVSYSHDVLNRLADRTDHSRNSVYTYDNVGNLARQSNPNGTAVTYVYDALNHLTGLKTLLTSNSSLLTSYAYTLGPTGNRTSVTELNGRSVTYSYDNIYRETNEQVTADPNGNQGALGYTFDRVGNRQTRTSGLTAVPTQAFAYDNNDRCQSDGFRWDDDGNMLTDDQGRTYTYNALDQLTHVTGTNLDVSYSYDGDGLRISKTNNLTGVTTNYLWDTQNYTGSPQVLEELQNGQVTARYGYGLYLESQDRFDTPSTSYYVRDGQGSVRALTDASGTITDNYDTDSYGDLIRKTGVNTQNNYIFDTEYRDADIGLIYLRARWYDTNAGNFISMDSYEGNNQDPISLHKYKAFRNDGVNFKDPSGNDSYTVGGRISELLKGLVYSLKKGDARQYLSKYPTEIFIPQDVDIDENIERSFFMSFSTWFGNVFPEGAWDYKYQYGFDNINGKRVQNKNYQKLANLANFNFGATGKAEGIGESVLLRGAGGAEIAKYGYLLYGFIPAFNFPDYFAGQGQGFPVSGAPYGDAPRDKLWIQQGFKYFGQYYASQ
jgi:RHS repeat-associated protein